MSRKPVERRPIGLGSDSIRQRLATTRPENRSDIGHIWREQNRLAKEQWKLGPQKISASDKVKQIWDKIKVIEKSVLRPTLLHVRKIKNPKDWFSKKLAIPATLLALVLVGFMMTRQEKAESPSSQSASLGVQSQNPSQDDRSTDEKPDFTTLYPVDKEGLTSVTRRAPSGDLIHSFSDSLSDTEIEVTQQKVPESFTGQEAQQLEYLAKNFLADNVIQVDELIIYHGRDEKTDVQSLFFIKKDSLVSIRSAKPLSDDIWAAYILSLQ